MIPTKFKLIGFVLISIIAVIHLVAVSGWQGRSGRIVVERSTGARRFRKPL